MKEQLEKHIARSNLVKLFVNVDGDGDEYTGIPLSVSRSLVAILNLDEFHFNGCRVLRLEDVVKIRRGRFETTQQRILKSTGALSDLDAFQWLRIESWRSLLQCLKDRRACVCISCGLIKVNVFAIGEINGLADKSVQLKSFDAHGQWCKPKHRIAYSDITEILFGDEYSVTFNEFMTNRYRTRQRDTQRDRELETSQQGGPSRPHSPSIQRAGDR